MSHERSDYSIKVASYGLISIFLMIALVFAWVYGLNWVNGRHPIPRNSLPRDDKAIPQAYPEPRLDTEATHPLSHSEQKP